MQWQLLWYVLAGLIIGFTASTLWEWLYFRRKRMDLRDQRLFELETELRITREQLYDLRAQTTPSAAPPVADYQSPGVFLESEEAESLREEGYAPARDAVYVAREPETVHAAPPVYAPTSPPPSVAPEKSQPTPSTVTTAVEEARGSEDAARQRAVAATLGGVAVGAAAAEAMQARGEETDGEGVEEIEKIEEIGSDIAGDEVAASETIVTEPPTAGVEAVDEEVSHSETTDAGGIESKEIATVVVAKDESEESPEALEPKADETVSADAADREAVAKETVAAAVVAATLAEGESEESSEALEPEADETVSADAVDREAMEPEEVAAATLAEGEPEAPPESIESEAGEGETVRADAVDREAMAPEAMTAAVAAATLAEGESEAPPESIESEAGEGEAARVDVIEFEAMEPEEVAAATLAEGESEAPPEAIESEAGETVSADAADRKAVAEEARAAAVVAATLAEGESEELPEARELEAGEGEAAKVDVIDVEGVKSEKPIAAGDPFAILGWRPTRSPDDLTAIKGIGSRYRDRLYTAGIYTFAELAATDPEELRQAARVMRTVDIESWQRQAHELAIELGREDVRYFGPRPDDLTAIKGISPQIMRSLYQHGVVTYAQLAGLSERQLAEDLADLGVTESPDLRTWLVKAAELARVRIAPSQGGDQ